MSAATLFSSYRQILTLLKLLLLFSQGRSTPIFVGEIVSFRQVRNLARGQLDLMRGFATLHIWKQTQVRRHVSIVFFNLFHKKVQHDKSRELSRPK